MKIEPANARSRALWISRIRARRARNRALCACEALFMGLRMNPTAKNGQKMGFLRFFPLQPRLAPVLSE
jgi:hypothetical protein